MRSDLERFTEDDDRTVGETIRRVVEIHRPIVVVVKTQLVEDRRASINFETQTSENVRLLTR